MARLATVYENVSLGQYNTMTEYTTHRRFTSRALSSIWEYNNQCNLIFMIEYLVTCK